jgi:hypothetical protein
MLMQWADLKPGDILEFNPKFLEHMNTEVWVDKAQEKAPEVFDITDMEITGETMQLMFRWWDSNWSIFTNNGALWSTPEGPSVFRVVSLSGDE